MEIKTVPLLLIILGLSLLASCGRDAGLTKQLDHLEKQSDSAERADKASFARLKSIDESLQTIAQGVGANTAHQAKEEKQQAAKAEDVVKRLDALEGSLKTLAQEGSANRQSLEQKMGMISTQVSQQSKSKAEAPPARWSYVDKFRVERETEDLFQNSPLPAEQDPAKNPELGAKLAEYEALQQKSMSWRMMPMGRPSTETSSPAEMNEINKKLAELRIALAVYLGHQQQGTKLRDVAIRNAFREFAKGHYDLLIDRTFGDNQIYYKADAPVTDVTDQIIEFIRVAHTKQ